MVHVQAILGGMTKTCAIIPTYNESAAIAGLVAAIKARGLGVLVIDDGSTDGTADIARANGATILVNGKNLGKGASLIKGFSWCLAQGYEMVITIDGDGQHLPDEIALFLKAAEEHPDAGIILGNRMWKRRAMPLIRVLTNKGMSWIISLICRQNIPDTQCGYRLIRRRVLEKTALSTAKFEIESEILIKAARAGFTFISVPITSVYQNENSHINPFTDSLRFIRFIWRNRRP